MPTDSGRAATVEFEHVSKVYGQATAAASPGRAPTPGAVNDLSLAIPAGRICVLVGPSGCGKTTSLKMVNRLIEPTSGRILLDGVDAAGRDLTDLRRGIGYVIQQTGLFPHQTIVDNVGTVPRLLGWPAARVRERSEQLMGLVGLDPAKYAKRFPNQLSGGERQRVGVARALAADPPIMLMDEPFGAVDPIVRERLQDEFLRLQGELAKTILFVTHDIDEAIKMGDLVAVFQEGGRVAQFGTPTELLARPASDFVARFVGVDRALKRLSLSRVGEIELQPAAVGRVGDPVAEARQRAAVDPFPYLLLVDAADHPVGWVTDDALRGEGTLSEAMAVPMSPFLSVDTSLKDAMSLMLDADVHSGIVLDHDGHLLGLLTSDMIGAFLRRGTTGSEEAAQAAS